MVRVLSACVPAAARVYASDWCPSVRPSVCMSRRSIAGRRKDSRQSATAASVLRCDQRDEDRHTLCYTLHSISRLVLGALVIAVTLQVAAAAAVITTRRDEFCGRRLRIAMTCISAPTESVELATDRFCVSIASLLVDE